MEALVDPGFDCLMPTNYGVRFPTTVKRLRGDKKSGLLSKWRKGVIDITGFSIMGFLVVCSRFEE